MKTLTEFISEDFSLKGKANISKARNLDEIAANDKKMSYINYDLLYTNCNRFNISNDVKKRHDDGKKPETLLKTKDQRLIATRWLVSVLWGYEDYYDVLRTEIINRDILKEDSVDAFILYWHKRGYYYGDKKYNDKFAEYLEKYNVEI